MNGEQGCIFTLLSGIRRGNPCNFRCCMSSEFYCRRHHIRIQEDIEQNRLRLEGELLEELLEERRLENERLELETELIINEEPTTSCEICQKIINYHIDPIVDLTCDHVYHLKCYMLQKDIDKCVACDKKIYMEHKEDTSCSVCLENIEETDIYITKCNHHFHSECINSWKRIKNSCPNCRGDL